MVFAQNVPAARAAWVGFVTHNPLRSCFPRVQALPSRTSLGKRQRTIWNVPQRARSLEAKRLRLTYHEDREASSQAAVYAYKYIQTHKPARACMQERHLHLYTSVLHAHINTGSYIQQRLPIKSQTTLTMVSIFCPLQAEPHKTPNCIQWSPHYRLLRPPDVPPLLFLEGKRPDGIYSLYLCE